MEARLLENLKDAKRKIPPCVPPVWARTGHLQTLLGHLIPSPRMNESGTYLNVILEKETERIHSTYLLGTSHIVVYLFHGLGGNAEASYMQRTARHFHLLGCHVFISNHRGCGKGVGLAREPYHSGRADDLSKVIEHGRNMLPGHKHIAIGFSMSANALLLLAAKVRGDVQPDFAIAVNGPINLDRTTINLQKGLNRIYDSRFTQELKWYLKKNRQEDSDGVEQIKNVRSFEEHTARLGGFKDRADYHSKCSAKQYLSKIDIPTVILTAEDDPFVSVEDYKEARYSEFTFLHIEKHGGHMGYLMKKGMSYERWLDKALETYLTALS